MVAGVTKITREGQIRIPDDLREEFGLAEGDPMVVELRDGVMIVRRATIVEQTAGALAKYGQTPPPTIEEMNEAVVQALAEEDARYE